MAGSILIAWMRRTGAPRPMLLNWRSAAIVGGLMLLGGNGGVTWAEQYVRSSLAALTWASGSLYSRRAPLPDRPLLGTGMEMLTGGVWLTLAGTLSGEWGELDLGAISASSALALTYLTPIGSLVAFTAYIWLLASHQAGARPATPT